jgi:hypothetical protein
MPLNKEEIAQCLIQAGLDLNARNKALKEIEEAELAKKEEREANKDGPKAKNRFVICVRGDSELKKILQAGWVVKVPESSDNNTIIDRMTKAANLQNKSRKSKKMKLFTWRDFFLACKRKNTKQHDIQPITKEAVEVVVLEKEDIN